MTDSNKAKSAINEKISLYAIALNYLPLAYIVTSVLLVLYCTTLMGKVTMAIAWLYLVPPVACRITLLIFGYPTGRSISQNSNAFKVWWFLTQLQMVYNRLPWLEEILRLLPGIYATWLLIWGSKVSPFAYWAPGSKVVDRYLVKVASGSVVGIGAILSGHLTTFNETQSFILDIEFITIEEGAIIGANAALSPGCRVAKTELVPAGRMMQPFTTWRGGRKIRE
ncbi:MAG: hypothetical protein GY742_17185 [Hyphomicrobiales bacterium]|nr:hypothetical protein [Hyphomicrobiales bacterium]